MSPTLILLALVVLLSFTTEATTGFGSIIIAVTLGAHFYPIHDLVPLVVPLNVVLTTWIVARHHGHVAWRLLLTQVLPLMGIGLVAGQLLFQRLAGETLELGLAVLVVVLAARELFRLRPKASAGKAARPIGLVARLPWLLAAGVVHGIYATGGPLLVYVLGRTDLDKSAFRSTLATVWLTLNVTLTITFLITGRLNAEVLPRFGVLVPVVILAIVLGERLHHRIPERPFRIAVFTLLLFAGATLLFR